VTREGPNGAYFPTNATSRRQDDLSSLSVAQGRTPKVKRRVYLRARGSMQSSVIP
jgi:hypothetical protein